MRTKALVGVCVAMMVTACASPAVAETERILDFHAHLAVGSDGWLTVTETIHVYAAGKQIKRGIYRDIPVRYRLGAGLYMGAPLEIVRVERNGKVEPYHTSREGINRRIYIGQENVLLEHGEYVYTLTYRIGRMIHADEDTDELYYNGTAQYWDFPIGRAAVTVTLPRGILIGAITHRAYTGRRGEQGTDYTSSIDEDGRVLFEVTRPLPAGEGMTVVVTWPKGFVDVQPTTTLDVIRGNVALAVGVIGGLVVLAYYVIAWINIGRDPDRGIIIPLFDPPKSLGPAAVRYVWKMGYSKVCLTATIIQLAVARYLRIEDDDGEYTLVGMGDASSDLLTGAERAVGGKLVDRDERLTLKQSNHSAFQKAIKTLKKELAATCKGTLFFSNTSWFVFGVLLSVLTLAGIVVSVAVLEGNPGAAFMAVWLSFWTFGVVMLSRAVVGAWRGAAGGGKGRLLRKGGAVYLTLFAIPFFAAEAFVLVMLLKMTSFWLAPLLLLLGGLNARFCHLLKRPTIEGRAAMDHIEGLRMYLATAEQDLLNTAHPPEKTPELFERFLPYAVALNVETEWAGKFEDLLTAAQAEGGYQPVWYHGAAFSTIGAGGLASSMGSSMSSALSSASAAPSSGGGSGGGGSSGGGGGGGGGGGW